MKTQIIQLSQNEDSISVRDKISWSQSERRLACSKRPPCLQQGKGVAVGVTDGVRVVVGVGVSVRVGEAVAVRVTVGDGELVRTGEGVARSERLSLAGSTAPVQAARHSARDRQAQDSRAVILPNRLGGAMRSEVIASQSYPKAGRRGIGEIAAPRPIPAAR